jgi:hypothetical protein
VSTDLKHLLYHQICREFEDSSHAVEENITRYVDLLLKARRLGSLSVALAVLGQDTKDPELKDLDLLEKSGVLEAKIKFTERNVYKIFTVTDRGVELASKIEAEKKY